MTVGPIDFIALEFPGNKFDGQILHNLMDLINDRIIRVMDLVVVQKGAKGEVTVRELQEMDPSDVRIVDPLKVEVTSLITRADLDMIAEGLPNNTTAGVMLFENLWAVKLKQAFLDANARLIMQERIPHDVVQAALEDVAVLASSSK
jgi:hypothetical protein